MKEAREALIGYLEREHGGGSSRNQITVVFDGKSSVCYLRRASVVKVLFSSEETADELIKTMVEKATNKKNLYVVTDDRALQQSVRGAGARVLSVNHFFDNIEKRQRPLSQEKGISNEKYIPKTTEYRINDELKKVWID